MAETINLSKVKREKLLFKIELLKQQINDEDMIATLNEVETELTKKKYGLVWEEHSEEVDEQMKSNIPIFIEDKDKEIVSDEKLPFNFLLEGDNLHSLKLLEKTHKGKIDVIYIDPPYNTGKEDFIYDDKYIETEDAFRHSKWLSFMNRRLQIAKKLLSNEGAIFIQISDVEVAQLKNLCDEIFGEENFLNIISVNMKNIAGASGGGEDKKFKKNCEYILIYAKDYSFLPLFNGAYDYEEISDLVERYRKEGVSWKYTTALVDGGDKQYVASTTDGDGKEIRIYKRTNYIIKSINQIIKDENISEKEAYHKYSGVIFQTAMPQSSIRPRVMQKVNEIGRESDLYSIEYIPKTGRNKGKMYEQFYKGKNFRLFAWLKDVSEEIDGKLYKKTLQGTYWNFIAGTKNLTKEGNVDFPNGKKPVDLLRRIISLYPKKNICVLDFFAGSGTTGHAVISENKEDGGCRKFILCTNNENEICESKTYPRLTNVIRGYTTEKGKVFNPNNANLKYYKTSFIPKSNDGTINSKLLDSITELIKLEHHCEIDNHKIKIAFDDDEMDSIIKEDLAECEKLFVSNEVFLTSNQEKILENYEVEIIDIPEYYFAEELREADEI